MGCAAMRLPRADDEGAVIPHDDPQILAEDTMLRGIPDRWVFPTEDGGRRITSAAFNRSSESRDKYRGMSLGAKKILDCAGISADEWAEGRFRAIVCFPASELRGVGVRVGWDPQPDDPAHCGAWGGLPMSLRKRLAREAKRRFLYQSASRCRPCSSCLGWCIGPL